MRLYIMTTGVLFGLITVAHVLRMFQEGHLFSDPFYLGLTLLSAGLALWAARLVLVQGKR